MMAILNEKIISQLKVGQKVKIKPKVKGCFDYFGGYTDDMCEYQGMVTQITEFT